MTDTLTLTFGENLEYVAPICEIKPGLKLAIFDTAGKRDFCRQLAERMVAKMNQQGWPLEKVQGILTAGKATTLALAVAEALGLEEIVIAEKSDKSYWTDSLKSNPLQSITAQKQEQFFVGGERLATLQKAGQILIVDDVCSTGATLTALIDVATQAGATVVGSAVPAIEGEELVGKEEFGDKAFSYLIKLPL